MATALAAFIAHARDDLCPPSSYNEQQRATRVLIDAFPVDERLAPQTTVDAEQAASPAGGLAIAAAAAALPTAFRLVVRAPTRGAAVSTDNEGGEAAASPAPFFAWAAAGGLARADTRLAVVALNLADAASELGVPTAVEAESSSVSVDLVANLVDRIHALLLVQRCPMVVAFWPKSDRVHTDAPLSALTAEDIRARLAAKGALRAARELTADNASSFAGADASAADLVALSTRFHVVALAADFPAALPASDPASATASTAATSSSASALPSSIVKAPVMPLARDGFPTTVSQQQLRAIWNLGTPASAHDRVDALMVKQRLRQILGMRLYNCPRAQQLMLDEFERCVTDAPPLSDQAVFDRMHRFFHGEIVPSAEYQRQNPTPAPAQCCSSSESSSSSSSSSSSAAAAGSSLVAARIENRSAEIARLVPPAHAFRARRVLDFGCAEGGITNTLAGVFGIDTPADVHGCDVRDIAAAAAEAGFTFSMLSDGDSRLPYPDGHFCAVTALMVLHHVPDADASVREIVRVLRPGGMLVLREHDCASPTLAAVIDTLHGFYAAVWSDPPETPDFSATYFAAYRSRVQWRDALERAGLRQDPTSPDGDRVYRAPMIPNTGGGGYGGGRGHGGGGRAPYIKNPFHMYFGLYWKPEIGASSSSTSSTSSSSSSSHGYRQRDYERERDRGRSRERDDSSRSSSSSSHRRHHESPHDPRQQQQHRHHDQQQYSHHSGGSRNRSRSRDRYQQNGHASRRSYSRSASPRRDSHRK